MTKPLIIPGPLGLKLAALFDEPKSEGPHPLVILLHGNTGWKEEEHLTTLAQELAKAGIAALRFDAPGSGKSEGTWAEHYRVTNYIEAVTNVYDFAKANLSVDTTRVGLWAHSMGGIVATYAATRHPGRYSCLCLCESSAGPMSRTEEASAAQWRETGWKTLETEIFGDIKLPYAYHTDRSQYRTPEEIAKLHLPLLVIAGTRDDIVPAASVRRIFDAANQSKQYLEFNADHEYKYDPPMLKMINAAELQFFQKHLQ